jgi:hypothetical protein
MMEFFKDVVRIIRDLVHEGERRVTYSFYNIKRKLFRFAMELLLFSVAILFILVGGVLVLDNYFPVEWILLVAGLLLLNFVLITAKFK